MGARPSSFKQGAGGFLNGVTGTITNYFCTDEFNGQPFKPHKIKDDKGKLMDAPHSLYVLLSVRPDEATEDVTTILKAGAYEDWNVSEDGHTLTPAVEGANIPGGSAFGKLLSTICKPTGGGPGFDETQLDEEAFNWEPIIGSRVKFAQVVRTGFGAGKRLSKKTGKEYDRTDLVVEEYYETGQVQAKANGKAKPGTTQAAKGKANGKVAAVPPDVSELAEQTIRALLAASPAKQGIRTLNKDAMKVKILMKLNKGPEKDLRDHVIKWAYDDNNLSGIENVAYDRETGDLSVEA